MHLLLLEWVCSLQRAIYPSSLIERPVGTFPYPLIPLRLTWCRAFILHSHNQRPCSKTLSNTLVLLASSYLCVQCLHHAATQTMSQAIMPSLKLHALLINNIMDYSYLLEAVVAMACFFIPAFVVGVITDWNRKS